MKGERKIQGEADLGKKNNEGKYRYKRAKCQSNETDKKTASVMKDKSVIIYWFFAQNTFGRNSTNRGKVLKKSGGGY